VSLTATTYRRPDSKTMQLLYRFAGAALARGGRIVVGPAEAAVLCGKVGRVAMLGSGEHVIGPGVGGDFGAVLSETATGQPIPGPLYFVRMREMTGQALQGTLTAGGVRFRMRALISFAVSDPSQLVREVARPRPDVDGPTLLTAMSRQALVELGDALVAGSAPSPQLVQTSLEGYLGARGLRITGVGPIELAPEGGGDPGVRQVRVLRALGLSPGDEIDAERSEGDGTGAPVARVVVGGRARTVIPGGAPPVGGSGTPPPQPTPSASGQRPVVVPPQTSSRSARMAQCANCGNLSDGGKFCHYCGFPMAGAVQVDARLCGTCGRAWPQGTPFCGACGTAFARA
jgi:hypothetical protein